MARRNDHTREEIHQMAIQAAISILNAEGISGLSTRKVANQIGYTAGTLYLVFQNLDELIMHVNAATLDELHKILSCEINTTNTPQDIIRQLAIAYLTFAREHYARWSLLFTHQLPAGEAVPGWLDDKVRDLFTLVGMPLKQILPELDHTQCMRAIRVLWSGVHGACDLGLSDKLSLGGEISAEELITELVENYLQGMMQKQVSTC